MKKYLIAVLLCAASIGFATDYLLNLSPTGAATPFSVDTSGNVVAGGGVTATSFSGPVAGASATVSGFLTTSANAQTVTNGQVVTLAGTYNSFTMAGSDDTFTNTITLANPTVIGRIAIIAVATSSNVLGIADSGNVKLSAAVAANTDDTLVLIATATNVWTELDRSAN